MVAKGLLSNKFQSLETPRNCTATIKTPKTLIKPLKLHSNTLTTTHNTISIVAESFARVSMPSFFRTEYKHFFGMRWTFHLFNQTPIHNKFRGEEKT